jgi:hypothetical protein
MGGLSDLMHGVFVVVASASYLLPLHEGAVARRSTFYSALFATLLLLSVLLHVDDAGIAEPLPQAAHDALQNVSMALSYFLFNVMLLVALEVRGERLGRSVAAAGAVVAYATNPSAVSRNVALGVVLAVITLVLDVAIYKRRFTAAYWRRLGLIAAMAAVGAGLFAGLRMLWLWHGIWHAYTATATWLLLLAQRHKHRLASGRAADGGGIGGGLSSSSSSSSLPGGGGGGGGGGGRGTMGGAASNVDTLTTPVKRAGRATIGEYGAAASALSPMGRGAAGGAAGSAGGAGGGAGGGGAGGAGVGGGAASSDMPIPV